MNTVNSNTFQNLKNKFNHISSKNIVFREFTRSDGFPLFTATQNPDFNKHLLWVAPEKEQDIFIRTDKIIRENTLNEAIILSVCDKYTGTWVGLVRINKHLDGLEMGILLHPNYWGGKTFASAVGPVLECTFKNCPDIPVYIRTSSKNEKTQSLAVFYQFEKQDELTEEIHPIYGTITAYTYKYNDKKKIPETEVSHY